MKISHISKTLLVIVTSLAFVNAYADTNMDNNVTTTPHQTYVNTTENGDAAPSDSSLTANVKSAFVKEKLFGDADVSAFTISVETNDGVVHLTGTADNQVQADNAVKLAKAVAGVKSVVSDVTIKVPAAN